MNLFKAAMHPVSFWTSLIHVGAFDAALADDEAELFARRYAEDALVRVELPAVLAQGCQNLFKVVDEGIGVFGLDDHVIHVGFDVLVELPLEAGLDSSLIGGASVLQPEGHGRVAVRAKRGDERGLLLVFFLDSDLVVPGVAVEEAEQVVALRGVDDLINLRQPKGVLGAVLVEIGVVDAHPPFVRVLLGDEDGVGKPLRIEDFSDEASRE
jgi:hypothetical protein